MNKYKTISSILTAIAILGLVYQLYHDSQSEISNSIGTIVTAIALILYGLSRTLAKRASKEE